MYQLYSLTTLVSLLCLALVACEPKSDVFEMNVGECFQDSAELTEEDSEGVSSLPKVDCAEHHDNEVYHTFDIEGDEFPGISGVEEAAEVGCLTAFEGFVGTPYDSSRYYINSLYPTPQTWNEMNDREIVCYLFLPDGMRSQGSAQGSGV